MNFNESSLLLQTTKQTQILKELTPLISQIVSTLVWATVSSTSKGWLYKEKMRDCINGVFFIRYASFGQKQLAAIKRWP